MRRIISNYFVAFILLVSGATAKTVLDTDLTSDFTSTNDDQYPWNSALPPRGPYNHHENTKWTNDIKNIDNIPINQYDESTESTELTDEKTWPFIQNNYKSLDIYDVIKNNENKNFMDINNSKKQMNTDKLNLLNNIEHEKFKVKKNIELQNKIQHQVEYSKNFKINENKNNNDKKFLIKRKERSTINNNYNKYIELNDPIESRVTPIILDIDIDNSNDYDYIEDELFRLKKLEKKKIIANENKRGDMDPELSLYSDPFSIDHVFYVPTRGDVVSQPLQKINENKRTKRMTKNTYNNNNNYDMWGFGENDGMSSDDYDTSINVENNKRQNEYNKRRNEWERKRNDEIERRKIIAKQMAINDEKRIQHEIDLIRIEHERKLAKEHQEQEKKLRLYIERNRPIVINNQNNQNELKRRNLLNQNTKQTLNYSQRTPSSSSTKTDPQQTSRNNQDDRNHIYSEKLSQRNNINSNKPYYYSHNPSSQFLSTRQSQSQRDNENNIRQKIFERQKNEQESLRQRHYQDQRIRHNNIFEQKRPKTGVINITKIEHDNNKNNKNYQSKDEIARLESLPVTAKIIIVPKSSTNILTRGYFDDNDNLPSIDPNKPGIKISNFPVSKTQRPPTKTPSPCSWAVIHCCPRNNNNNKRLTQCFENFNCPSVNWDPNPCRQSISNAARDEASSFYATKH